MAVFLDTSFLLALKNKDDKNHKDAKNWMKRFLKNEFGKIYVSTFVFDELVTISMIRVNNMSFTQRLGNYIMSSSRINVINVNRNDFHETWSLFKKYGKSGLSFTDCSILAQCKQLRCNLVATYDSHFNGLIGTNLES